LEPHLTTELNGTQLRYPLRGRLYLIDLSTEQCAVTVGACTLSDSHPFGVNATDTGLEYFPGTNSGWAMRISQSTAWPLTIQIESWPDNPDAPRQWTEAGPQIKGSAMHTVARLRPNAKYELKANGQIAASLRADGTGRVIFARELGDVAPQKLELDLAVP
jgi:hypothetical protein